MSEANGAPAATPAPEAAEPIAQAAIVDAGGPVFVQASRRSQTIVLNWPIEFRGTIYDRVTVRRLSVSDVEAWADAYEAMTAEQRAKAVFPIYDVPDEVILGLDADDSEALGAVAVNFLPRRWRTEIEQSRSSGGVTQA